MLEKTKFRDGFARSVFLVLAGTSLVNFFNFIYQVLIAHYVSALEFAAFNAILAIYLVVSTPLSALQTAVVKYCAEFNADSQAGKVKAFLSRLSAIIAVLAVATFFVSYFLVPPMMDRLKIYSDVSGYILVFLLALSWVIPIFMGGVQGLERFGWLMAAAVTAGGIKLGLCYLSLSSGFGIAGALGSFLSAVIIQAIICSVILKSYIVFWPPRAEVRFSEILFYLLPILASTFCFICLVNLDMVLVKLFFTPAEAGSYALAQMLGKIFLFLPSAISIVLLPRVSGLHARRSDTASTLRASLLLATALCVIAVAVYNLAPSFTLKVLTGKAPLESITLGRFFSISMTFASLLFILITYFLSVEDLRFIKYLVLLTLAQVIGIALFHSSLVQVQLIMCVNMILLFSIHLGLILRKKPAGAVCRT